jgi:hypothetical protein
VSATATALRSAAVRKAGRTRISQRTPAPAANASSGPRDRVSTSTPISATMATRISSSWRAPYPMVCANAASEINPSAAIAASVPASIGCVANQAKRKPSLEASVVAAAGMVAASVAQRRT